MVLPDLKGNGAERLAMTLADGLIDKGHNTHIILFKNFIELKSRKKIPIHIFNYHFRWIPKSIRAFFCSPIARSLYKENLWKSRLGVIFSTTC